MGIKRLLEPAFSKKNYFISFWMIIAGALFVLLFGGLGIIIDDPPRELAIADAKLRDTAWQRMREACFTDEQIKDYWYNQGFWEHPNRLLVVIKGREALCGGRGLCGCERKERVPDSV